MMTEDLRTLHAAIVAFSEKFPNEVPPMLENALVSAYRNGLIASARRCQEQMRYHQTIADRAEPASREAAKAAAAAHACFECAEFILDKIVTIEAVLQPVP